MRLTCHTRDNTSPQGKPRVYFTGHSEDLATYSEEIFADILKLQDCAIYYDAEPGASFDKDELFHELEQMQLFVIPVTHRFLRQPNRALDVEFGFAEKHHIPILPLAQEHELEEEFNSRCGNRQILNKHESDPTALPYAERLESFLTSVLVRDSMVEQVRMAFDAYLFLSYRKKDRNMPRSS